MTELKPLVQVVPNSKDIHAPSRLQPTIKMNSEKFINNYADKGKSMSVSLHDDGISNPQSITTYTIPIPDEVTGGYTPGETIIVSED